MLRVKRCSSLFCIAVAVCCDFSLLLFLMSALAMGSVEYVHVFECAIAFSELGVLLVLKAEVHTVLMDVTLFSV